VFANRTTTLFITLYPRQFFCFLFFTVFFFFFFFSFGFIFLFCQQSPQRLELHHRPCNVPLIFIDSPNLNSLLGPYNFSPLPVSFSFPGHLAFAFFFKKQLHPPYTFFNGVFPMLRRCLIFLLLCHFWYPLPPTPFSPPRPRRLCYSTFLVNSENPPTNPLFPLIAPAHRSICVFVGIFLYFYFLPRA